MTLWELMDREFKFIGEESLFEHKDGMYAIFVNAKTGDWQVLTKQHSSYEVPIYETSRLDGTYENVGTAFKEVARRAEYWRRKI